MTTLVFAAHADDEVVGVGGTIAKLAKKEKVIVIVFSYGGGSFAGLSDRVTSWPPFMSEERLIKVRTNESKRADNILGVSETLFLGIKGNLPKEFSLEQKKKITDILKKYKPKRVFYHSSKDGHPDHLAVTRVLDEIISKMKKKPEVMKYQINFFDFSRKHPSWIYDVSKEYKTKMKALKEFKSQRLWTTPLKIMVMLKGIIFGKRSKCKFAEYFYSE